MSNDVEKKTKSSLYWNVGLKIPYEIFRFFASIITARILDPQDFGIVSIATMVIFYANSFTNFGFNQVLVQRKEITENHIKTVFTVNIIMSLIMIILLLLASEPIAHFFNSTESIDVIRVMSVVFILTALHDLPYVLLRRELEFKLITIVDMAREILMTAITLGLAVYGYKYWSIVYGYIISMVLASAYLIYRTRLPLRFSYNHTAFKELIGTSIWSFLQMQIYFLSNRIDRIIVGRYFNTAALGLYEKSKSLSLMPAESLGDKLNTVFFSSFSRIQDNQESVNNIFKKGLLVVTAITFPIYAGMLVTAHHFVIVLLGEKWSGMIDIFQIMAIAGIFASVNGFLAAMAVGSGHFKSYTLRYGISTLVLFVGCLIAANSGIDSIAIVYTLYSLLLTILTFGIVKERFGINWAMLLLTCLPASIASLCMGIMIVILKRLYFAEYSAMNFIALITIGMTSYSIAMLIMPSVVLNDIRSSLYRDATKLFHRLRYRR